MTTRGGSPGSIGRVQSTILLIVILALSTTTLSAQIPDEFQNLQVLPKDIEKRQLIDMMKSFSSALDVRCTFCHVGDEEAALSDIDFPSDDNPRKQKARVMIRMVEAINSTHLTQLDPDAKDLLQVSCVTCHRGQPVPRSLEQVLAAVVTEDGIEAALAKYRELRERYYGRATFDFSAGTLTRLARQLAGSDQVPAAIAFLELNAKHYPEEMTSYYLLGELYTQSNRKDQAIRSFEKALAVQPDHAIVRRKLEQLKGQ